MLNVIISVFLFLYGIILHEYIHMYLIRLFGGQSVLYWTTGNKNLLSWRPSVTVSNVKGKNENMIIRLFPVCFVLPVNTLMFASLVCPVVPRLLSVGELWVYSIFFGCILTCLESYHDILEVYEIWLK